MQLNAPNIIKNTYFVKMINKSTIARTLNHVLNNVIFFLLYRGRATSRTYGMSSGPREITQVGVPHGVVKACSPQPCSFSV